jgi:hypothetical protein
MAQTINAIEKALVKAIAKAIILGAKAVFVSFWL